MDVDYRKLCVDLFGTDDVNELTKIARTCKERNPRNAGRKKKFTSGDAKTIRRLIEDGMTVNEVAERFQTSLYGDNVFEKDGIRRDRTGDGEKTRCLCGKRGIFNRDGPAMGPQIIRQLE